MANMKKTPKRPKAILSRLSGLRQKREPPSHKSAAAGNHPKRRVLSNPVSQASRNTAKKAQSPLNNVARRAFKALSFMENSSDRMDCS